MEKLKVKKSRKQDLTYKLQEPTQVPLEPQIEVISPEKTNNINVLKITPEVHKRAAQMMSVTPMSPGTADYLQNTVGPTTALLDDQDHVSTSANIPQKPKTPRKRKANTLQKEGKGTATATKPPSPKKAKPSEEEEPFFDRLVKFVMDNKHEVTGLTMQTIPTNQWITVNLKSQPLDLDFDI